MMPLDKTAKMHGHTHGCPACGTIWAHVTKLPASCLHGYHRWCSEKCERESMKAQSSGQRDVDGGPKAGSS